jgi:intracellular sulfur oxidation DsrE/DsrF family protein
MLNKHSHTPSRRSFLARFSSGAAAFGAAFAGGAAVQAQSTAQTPAPQPVSAAPGRFTIHPEDDWFDQPGAKHRIFFDTTTADGFGEALAFANNTFTGNRNGYGLTDADIAIVICARHRSTVFAYDAEMWAKYGAAFAERNRFNDPKTGQPPTVNVFQAEGYGSVLTSNGLRLDALIRRGVRLAVCTLSTRANAGLIAQKTGRPVDEVFKELSEHLVPNARLVPAGIVAVNRAQERGYSLAVTG